MKRRYDEYVQYCKIYGFTPITSNNPFELLKARLFSSHIKGDLIASNPPRPIKLKTNQENFFQCNETIAPLLEAAIVNSSGEYANQILNATKTLTTTEKSTVTNLPEFYFDYKEDILAKLEKEGSFRLKDLALYFN